MKIAKPAFLGLLIASMILQACSFASFIAAAEADLPPAVAAISNITNIIAPGIGGAIQAASALALTSMNLLCGSPAPGAAQCDPTSLVGQYQLATDPATKTTLLQKIDAAMTAVSGHLSDILTAAKVLNPVTRAIITAAVALVIELLNTVQSFIPATTNVTAQLTRTRVPFSSPMKASDFKAKFNGIVKVAYPKAVI